MDGNLATTYTLIHSFLRKQSLNKVADALKKAAKAVVILKDDIEIEGPQLDEIIQIWKSIENDDTSSESSSDSDSDSSSDSSDSSESTSSSSSQESAKPTKATKPKSNPKSKEKLAKKSSSSSSSSSSDCNSDLNTQIKDISAAKKPIPSEHTDSSSSGSGSESDDESSDSTSQKAKSVKKKLVKTRASNKLSSQTLSSTSSNSTSDSDGCLATSKKIGKAPVAKLAPKKIGKTKSSDSSSSDSSPGEQSKLSVEVKCVNSGERDINYQVTKKRRTGDDGTAVTTATTADFAAVTKGERSLNSTGFSNKKNGRPTNERFMRVRPETVAMNTFVDNRYEAKAGASNDYGQRAHSDLIVTRGAGFRKEKNKKKRGSYRGGEITMDSHSFKFS